MYIEGIANSCVVSIVFKLKAKEPALLQSYNLYLSRRIGA